jgi:hypothetical protein
MVVGRDMQKTSSGGLEWSRYNRMPKLKEMFVKLRRSSRAGACILTADAND